MRWCRPQDLFKIKACFRREQIGGGGGGGGGGVVLGLLGGHLPSVSDLCT